jgi:hypothetical protein
MARNKAKNLFMLNLLEGINNTSGRITLTLPAFPGAYATHLYPAFPAFGP